MSDAIPAGFSRINLPPSGYLEANGPFYARRASGTLAIGLRIEPRHANSIGIAHGGLLMTLADVILTVGSNAVTRLSRFLTTASATCDFLSPAKVGDWIAGEVDVLRVTASHVFTASVIRTDAGDAVARVSGVLVVRGDPDPRFDADRYFQTHNP